MNYRHGFHAGNFADVFKHVVLVALLDRLCAKPTPLFYLDTHAGRGRYDLGGSQATRGNEWQSGIGRLLALPANAVLPPEIDRYVQLVRDLDPVAPPVHYPGSPLLALNVLRPGDRKLLAELQPREARALKEIVGPWRNVTVLEQDGYAALRQLPPREKRGLVLLDPPFEDPQEYARLGAALAEGWTRWPGGVYAAWYPLKAADRRMALFAAIAGGQVRKVLRVEAHARPPDSPLGLTGSGMLIVNPPWQLDTRLREIIPALLRRLALDARHCCIDWLAGE